MTWPRFPAPPGVLVALLLPALAAAATAPPAADAASDRQAATAYRQRVAAGDADAALKLGLLLSGNRVAAAQFGTAVSWYRKGCDLGSLPACHNAAVAYEYGRDGAGRDITEAATLYLRAAERAFLPSMFNLGVLYAKGLVTPPDNLEGYQWMLVARLSANQCADRPLCQSVIADRDGHREKLRSRLSAAEQRAAEQYAMKWKPKG